uniref:Uncharacterized protein n=1 Tax=Lepeophtheirus salmonis TaxID=72036 RepID=A0A0K2UWV0_LEPSM
MCLPKTTFKNVHYFCRENMAAFWTFVLTRHEPSRLYFLVVLGMQVKLDFSPEYQCPEGCDHGGVDNLSLDFIKDS